MKKPYQIEAQRAVKQLEAMAGDGNPAVQMVLPMAERVGWLRKGVGELIRQAGLQLMDLLRPGSSPAPPTGRPAPAARRRCCRTRPRGRAASRRCRGRPSPDA